jgi:SEC-C motif-containing protein
VAAETGMWQKLEILRSEAGGENDAEGRVEFKAHWLIGGRRGYLHETSRFLKEDGRWYYLDGQTHPAPAAGKTGRNDPCPCGSGKKFKKCCGA